MSNHAPKFRYLTDDQVYLLNEKHGWFEFGDAQSDVSRAFAQEAIAMHERIRDAAQDLLGALVEMEAAAELGEIPSRKAIGAARAAIAKATGEQA